MLFYVWRERQPLECYFIFWGEGGAAITFECYFILFLVQFHNGFNTVFFFETKRFLKERFWVKVFGEKVL